MLCGMADDQFVEFAGLNLRVRTVDTPVHYQPRCVFCGAEHKGTTIVSISNGLEPCHRCGITPPVFDNPDTYAMAMRGYCCPRCMNVFDINVLTAKGWCHTCQAITVTDIKVRMDLP